MNSFITQLHSEIYRMRWFAIALIVLIGVSGNALADTSAPPGMGQAAWWVRPCQLFERQVNTQQPLPTREDIALAALCQGLVSGVMAVNYISPPYLPFCEQDNATPSEYAQTFLTFLHSNPNFGDKNVGFVLLIALGTAYPESECMGGGR